MNDTLLIPCRKFSSGYHFSRPQQGKNRKVKKYKRKTEREKHNSNLPLGRRRGWGKMAQSIMLPNKDFVLTTSSQERLSGCTGNSALRYSFITLKKKKSAADIYWSCDSAVCARLRKCVFSVNVSLLENKYVQHKSTI